MNLLASVLLSSWLTLGWMPKGEVLSYERPSFLQESRSFLIEMGIEASLGPAFLSGSMRVPVWEVEAGSYWPSQLTSTVEVGLKIGSMTIAYKHGCSHLVVPFLPMWFEGSLVSGFDSGYDLFYITIRGGKK